MAALVLDLGGSLTATHGLPDGVGDVLRAMHLSPGPVFMAGAVALILLPQLAMALLGGWLGGTYKVRPTVIVERKIPAGSEPGAMAEPSIVVMGV